MSGVSCSSHVSVGRCSLWSCVSTLCLGEPHPSSPSSFSLWWHNVDQVGGSVESKIYWETKRKRVSGWTVGLCMCVRVFYKYVHLKMKCSFKLWKLWSRIPLVPPPWRLLPFFPTLSLLLMLPPLLFRAPTLPPQLPSSTPPSSHSHLLSAPSYLFPFPHIILPPFPPTLLLSISPLPPIALPPFLLSLLLSTSSFSAYVSGILSDPPRHGPSLCVCACVSFLPSLSCWVHDFYITETCFDSLKGLQVLPPLVQNMSASENILLSPSAAWTGPARKGPVPIQKCAAEEKVCICIFKKTYCKWMKTRLVNLKERERERER